jgi:hypothetical protein
MDKSAEQLKAERRRMLARREIEFAIDEVIGKKADLAWCEWYRALVMRGPRNGAGERVGR